MTFEEHVAGWSSLHGGLAPSPLVRRYLALVLRLARPVARTGVHPDVLTAASLLVALPALWAPAWAAGLLVLGALLLDALDGTVALLQGRPTAWGYLLDSLVDRVVDGIVIAALYRAGAPGWLAIACGAGVVLLEYTRARAGNAGGDEVVTVTVAERPVRVLVPASGLLVGMPGAALVVTTSLTAAALAQLLIAARRQLAATE